MRYEMGAELAERLANHGEVTIRPALSVLAEYHFDGDGGADARSLGNYDVGESGGRLVARIGNTMLPDLKARKKYFAAQCAIIGRSGTERGADTQQGQAGKEAWHS